MANHCLVLNMDHRTDLWDKLKIFRDEWSSHGKSLKRISGTNYINKKNVLNDYIKTNRINLNGSGFRNTKTSFLGELGCYDGHYNCWKYIVENNIENCLIIEDGVTFLRNDYHNVTINKNLDIVFVNEEMKQNSEGHYVGYGTQGYILSLKGAKQLLKLCYTLSAPIDLQIRHLCNTKELTASVLSSPFVKRNADRAPSIEGIVLNDQNDLNAKQNTFPIIQRILMNLLEKNVNIDDYI
jgi:GR25 family glycosyltransferase involved in LPS biosynthesis